MLQAWQPILGLSQDENDRARLLEVGYKALAEYESGIRRRAREVMDQLERERPYRHRHAGAAPITMIRD